MLQYSCDYVFKLKNRARKPLRRSSMICGGELFFARELPVFAPFWQRLSPERGNELNF